MAGPDVDKLGRQTLHDADPQMTARRDALFKAFGGPIIQETVAEIDALKADSRLDTLLTPIEKTAALEAIDFERGVFDLGALLLRGLENASQANLERRLTRANDVLEDLDARLHHGQVLSLEDQGRYHAAYIFVNQIYSIASAARPAQRLGRGLGIFSSAPTTPEQGLAMTISFSGQIRI